MKVVTLGGGIGGGKFLRGVAGALSSDDAAVAIVNTGDDMSVYGLHVSPDIDQVLYWLSGLVDRDKGWGRSGDTHHAMDQLRALGQATWFGLGDLDLGLQLRRSQLLADGRSLTDATEALRRALGITVRVMPMSDDPLTTRVDVAGPDGTLDLHFQEYWVRDRAEHAVLAVRFSGADTATPSPGVLQAIADADRVILCPSNPVTSIGPILAVPGIRDAVAARRPDVVGVSPIIGGSALLPLANKLMPTTGEETSAFGVARLYDDLLGTWIIDHQDAARATEITRATGVNVEVTQTVMVDDAAAVALAQVAMAVP